MSASGPPPSVPTRFVHAGLTDVGRQRKHNEDCVLLKPELGLYAVADGMGGHNAGDVASKLVAQALGEFFASGARADLPDEYGALSPDAKRIAAGVRKANYTVHHTSHTQQQHHGMGSTVVAIHVAGGMVHIAHVGDSRCYRIRNGQIQQMTRDHSLINDALDMKPDLTKEELSRLPKNIITRALGMKDVVKVDVKSEPLILGDTFLLCSDGLTGMVPPEQILEVINLTHEPQEACELLIAEANDAGGTDNISAVIVRFEEALPDHDVVEDHDLVVEEHEELIEEELYDEPIPELDPTPDLSHVELSAYELEESAETAPELSVGEAQLDDGDLDEHEDGDPTQQRAAPPAYAYPPPPPLPLRPVSEPPPRPAAFAGFTMGRQTSPSRVDPPPQSYIAELDDGGPDEQDDHAPTLQVTALPADVEELPPLGDEEVADLVAAFARGEPIDLDLVGSWRSRTSVRRCAQCSHELYPGNQFCTECGARIESKSA